MNAHRVPSRPVLALTLSCVLGASASAQGFVERSSDLGILHTSAAGLDRIGNLVGMQDWIQIGIAFGDLDGDRDADILAVGRLTGNTVLRNDGTAYTDVTAASGLNENSWFDTSVALGDYDKDGDLDVFLGVHRNGYFAVPGFSRLYANDGTGRFEDVTHVSNTRGAGHTIYAKWWDVDNDGLLDLITGEFNETENRLYINNGDGSFSEQSRERGANLKSATHVIGMADLDQDGEWDMLTGQDWRVGVAAGFDPNTQDQHLHGIGDGYFENVSAGSEFGHDPPAGPGSSTMGITFADVDYDGDLDVYKTEVDAQFLMINHGWPSSGIPWTEEAVAYGVDNPTVPVFGQPGQFGQTVGWGCAFMNVDRDLWIDLVKVNGHVNGPNPRNQQNYMYIGGGPGAGFTFTDQTAALGFLDNVDDRGMAIADPDQDGDMDILISAPGGSLRFFENQLPSQGNGYLVVAPKCRTSAPDATGVVCRFTDSQGYPHMRLIGGDAPAASQNEHIAYFGLGAETSVDLTVEFPSGIVRNLRKVAPNQRLRVDEPELIRLSARVLAYAPATASTGAAMRNTPTTSLSSPASDPLEVVGSNGNPDLAGPQTLAIPGRPQLGGAELLTVTVFAHDQNGNPGGPESPVSIEVPGLFPAGPVRHLEGNEFRRRFFPASQAGRYRVEVEMDGWKVLTRPAVHFRGKTSVQDSTLRLVPEGCRAGSNDLVELLFSPSDENGILLGAGHQVKMRIQGELPATLMVDRGDGSYGLEFRAPANAGLHAIDFEIDGRASDGVATVEAAGVADPTMTLHYEEVPNPMVALHPHQLRFLVTPRDAAGLRLGRLTNVTVNAIEDALSVPVSVNPPAFLPSAQDNGDFFFVLERDPSTAVGAARGNYEVYADGVLILTQAFTF